ncbi:MULTISPECIES: extracellular solute-binding protein [Marivivens]|jgi:multiple sugar transport system substrate-binding protein|uniref:extracellular solute-binding protein n=1 Tax=Marivivens TaxID=1759396 RepID=UPI0007FD5675|nr:MULTISPECIES: extracellular solute-binding protein [Marivivens]MCL7407246.1 extracellular solute-binding protein [Marivivens geojensis]OBR35985.1 sugar-binding protein [Donghicola sp. JL3646]APO87477.1 sugar-binding protein [Marivivens sp. JLT3646]MCL7407464.1 extracellular solute-binding protein [Marivivens donghaensis]MDN3704557.1 extracellular solute-binding protein [Marivivens donghaensis]
MKLFTLSAGAMALTAGMSGAAFAQTELTMWYHGAGNEVESQIINQIVSDFNASQSDWSVTLESFPQAAYNDSVTAGALAGNLPDILDVDGPNMPNWAWSGYMQPLQIDEAKIANFLPGTKGIWDGKLYSIGLWDAAVALVTRQSIIDELGLRTPTLEQPWTQDEFMAALDAAKASGKYDFALDLGTAWTGEWFPYAFSPLLQSFGGDIIDRSSYKSAEGALNGDAANAWGNWWQGLFANGYAQATQDGADRDTGFNTGKYAFSWNGNWAALGTLAAYDDALFLPAPDLGNGPKIGAASWQFGVSASSEHPDGASAFIEFALQDKYLAAFSNGIGLIPATPAAAAMTENYKEGGPLHGFFALSQAQGVLRPVTPGYVVQAKVFEKAAADIANGADVADTLDAAVDEIEADIEKNGGYGH